MSKKTTYIDEEVHRKIKVKAAIMSIPMESLINKILSLWLDDEEKAKKNK